MPQTPTAAPYRTKTEIVMSALRERIVEGVLQPSERVLLRPLAVEFACSEIPVREAVRALSSEGLLELVPHGGARVTRLNAAETIELTEVRTLLEPRATRMAGEAMPAAGLAKLYGFLDAMRAVVDGRSNANYGSLNREFHRSLLAHCPNRRLASTINDLWDQSERTRAVHLMLPGHIATSIRQHEQIVAAIAERRFDDLEAVAVEHSRHGLNAVRQLAESAAAGDEPAAGRVSA